MAHLLTKIDIIAVGDSSELVDPCIAGYQQKLSQHVDLRVAEIPGKPAHVVLGKAVSEEAKKVAATVETIEQQRGAPFPILLCDHYGDTLTSEDFAAQFLRIPYLCVIVGGIYGLHDVLDGRDLRRVSFGRITLSPSLARLVATDQLYRAICTGNEIPYDLN